MSDEEAAPVPGWPEESAQRLQKARALRALGKDPYPTRFERSHRLGEVVSLYGARTLEELEALAAEVRVAGRVLTKRGHGKASFATIGDGETRLQLYVRQDVVGEEAYRVFDLVDLGDFVGVAGTVMRTRKGELSVQVARAHAAHEGAPAAAGEVARAHRRRGPLPPALPRPAREPRGAARRSWCEARWSPRCAASSTSAATSRSRPR